MSDIDKFVDEIEFVRKKNNNVWMSLLRIAMKHAPEETKDVLNQINKNDKKITELMQGLAETK